jgi:hypothetical protein
MVSKELCELPARWAAWLASQPETGMGYHVVDVVLEGGLAFKDVAVVDAHIIGEVRGHASVPFDPMDIAQVTLTHNRWGFRR